MLQALLFSLVTTTSAFTTHRYDIYDSFGNYYSSAPVLDNIFRYDKSNGRRPVQVYEYAKLYDGAPISDVFIGSSDGNRRIDTPYSYQNPSQRNRVAVTETAKNFNRFENSNQDRNYDYSPQTRHGQPVIQRDKQEVVNQRKPTNELNKTRKNLPLVSTQLDDVNRTLVITEKQITWNNEYHDSSEDNANITTRSINIDNNTNSLNESDKPDVTKIIRRAETNDATAFNKNRNQSDNAANNSSDYSTKTTQDNEVTSITQEPRTKVDEDDRWIWSNGEDQVVETTTLFDLGDRAAFSANGCPVGKARIGNKCVMAD